MCPGEQLVIKRERLVWRFHFITSIFVKRICESVVFIGYIVSQRWDSPHQILRLSPVFAVNKVTL